MTTLTKCPKCSGTGKVPYLVDDGVCYKCEGTGYIGGSTDEIEQAIKSRELRNAQPIAIRKINKALSNGQCSSLYELAINLGGEFKSYILTTTSADLFTTAYVDKYDYIFTCENPSESMLRYRNMLQGKYAIIEKIDDNKIKVSINNQ